HSLLSSVLVLPLRTPPPLHSFPTRRSSDLAEGYHHPELRPPRGGGRADGPGRQGPRGGGPPAQGRGGGAQPCRLHGPPGGETRRDRKSTRLNSSHVKISYAVFCLKKKKSRT